MRVSEDDWHQSHPKHGSVKLDCNLRQGFELYRNIGLKVSSSNQSLLSMTDRRRVNGPVGATFPPIFISDEVDIQNQKARKRTRPTNTIRRICEYHLTYHSLASRTNSVKKIYKPALRPQPQDQHTSSLLPEP